jgi:hypothetical protein
MTHPLPISSQEGVVGHVVINGRKETPKTEWLSLSQLERRCKPVRLIAAGNSKLGMPVS